MGVVEFGGTPPFVCGVTLNQVIDLMAERQLFSNAKSGAYFMGHFW